MTENNSNANQQIARAAGTVMFAILFGQLAGLVRGVLVARAFGASPELDAFFAANRVSETLFLLVAGGALGSAFIPTFTGLLAKNETDSAWRLAFSLANAVTLTLSLLAALIAFFAPQVVRFALAPGLSSNPELFALTVSLLRIQLVSAILFGLGGLIVGILNAHQIFLVPALTAALYQLGIIFGAVVLAPSMGIYGLAWGVVIGAVLYLMVQVPSLYKLVTKNASHAKPSAIRNFRFSLNIQDANVRQVLLLMGPRLIGVAVVQLNFWVNTWLASQMAPGSVSGLYFGFSLMLMAQAVIAQSVAIAAMPTFSAQHALGQQDEMRFSLASSLRGVIFLALPASVGLMVLRNPIISLLYQRGEFDEHSVQIVSWALLWYAAGMLGHSIMEILTRAFYAQHDTKTPVIIGTVAMLLNIVFSILFARMFTAAGLMPHGGLALANSLATALEATALFVMMRKRLNGIEGGHILRGALPSLAAAISMALGLLGWLSFGAELSAWILVPVGVTLGGAVYFAVLALLRVPELGYILNGVMRRIRR
ncbi:MAG: murein biosynthesis integral membrane protein MurJ [Anaerolineales bacterium]|jgi:putative peptidoglycan lipid II flippase|uniref:murein biosynthesis integral membrane protein MurJ n=1 Tax=Candidatus Villigracilis vicinus TaxID=3140679 RepID=UPI0031352E3A|nr:murein biosynthesis integral membrane protein MurJ [Anaerolineales bacterium]